VALGVAIALAGYAHFTIRKKATNHIINRLQRDLRHIRNLDFLGNLTKAFRKNTRWWRSVFYKQPTGWSQHARHHLKEVLTEANYYVQELNNTFTNPSGISQTTNGQPKETTTTGHAPAP
jgi:hypothetical protein